MIVFMIINMIISSLALARYTERHTVPGEAAAPNAIEEFLDSRFPDERIERIYPNAIIVD